ncbi:MAG: hydantoinase/oxoprolinase family protein [Actinobacteria bacterium]|nr:hydantoinase/oxoprolinase family protein [Actinomycetota bacterium]
MAAGEATTGPRMGVDVGGTFTDVVLERDGVIEVAKVPSTPQDQAEGVLAGGDRLGVSPADLARFVHGTTVATNAVLERAGAALVLVTTAGFRDLLEIGRQDRPSLYDLDADRPAPLVDRSRVVEAAERVTAEGEVLTELTDAEVTRVVDAVRQLAPAAVAVSLLFSFLDDRHERRLATALREALGEDVAISISSEVLPVFREYERTSTTALNAYVGPPMARYLGSLERRLRERSLGVPVEVMRSGGGTFTAAVAGRSPVHTLLSGPAAGAWGAAAVGRACGHDRIIAFDMGGTSTDVTLIRDGRPQVTAEGAIDGLPFAVTTTDIHTVGAGGGSIAWRDAGGALRVGPRSAGAVPGPACYGRGGTAPTVTDANVLLGHLDPGTQLGGEMAMEPERARAAVATLAQELGLDVLEAAAGILRVVEAQMAKALRVVSVEQGHDPRDFTLVPFGGAGPLHQGALARELGCRRVLVPPNAGVLSAVGLLSAPVTVDGVRTSLVAAADADPAQLGRIWDELEDDARRLVRDQGATVERADRGADLRYRGQAFELTVPGGDVDAMVDAFHDAHRDRYGYDQPEEAVELVNLRVRVEGPTPSVPLVEVASGSGASAAVLGTRSVVVGGRERECRLYDRSRLGAGDTFDGPAIVVGLDATCWVEPWQRVTVDRVGALVIEEVSS